jgi:endoglucanase
MADRLAGAGVREANGFSLNVSNYVATDKNIRYGKEISEILGGDVPFVIDTSRNGRGEAPGGEWCNPEGRGLGHAPTAVTGDPLVHAFLWVKRPGESDGACNGGPEAGAWFEKRALELSENARLN